MQSIDGIAWPEYVLQLLDNNRFPFVDPTLAMQCSQMDCVWPCAEPSGDAGAAFHSLSVQKGGSATAGGETLQVKVIVARQTA